MIIKKEKPKLPLKIYNDFIIKENIINEALGLFPKQNELVEKLTNIVLEMIKFNITEKKINDDSIPNTKGVILGLKILNELGNVFNVMKGQFYGIKDDYIVIDLIIPYFDRTSLNKEQLKSKIASCLTHELNHSYVFLSTYYNTNKIIEVPETYHKFLMIYTDDEINNDFVKDFSYLMYSTYSFEIQAMIPQVYQELSGYFKETKEELNIENFKKVLKKTNTFWTFYSGLYIDIPKIEKYLNTEENLNKFINIFNENNINLSKDRVYKLLNNIKNIYKNTLKDISRCAIAYYYDKIEKYNKELDKKKRK